MRKIKNKIYLESKYVGMHLGLVVTSAGLMLIDCPLKVEDAKEWVSSVSDHGKPRYLALLDAHPDRVLGARGVDIPIIAQDRALETIRDWADTYKGNLHPIGAEADRLKRMTGIQRAAPEITFFGQMEVHLGDTTFNFMHRPGPQASSTWIILAKEKTAFIGDAVVIDEPPYIGSANLKRWNAVLDELRGPALDGYTLICSQGSPVKREMVNAMARFLRKVEHRMDKIINEGLDEEQVGKLAVELLDDFDTPGSRRDQALLRLQVGLLDLASGDGFNS